MFSADGHGEKQVGSGHELGQSRPIGELYDYNESRKKEDGRTERSRQEGNEREKGDHLQEDQHEDTQKLDDADDRMRMQKLTVVTEPENEIKQNSERRGNQTGHNTGIGCMSDGARKVHAIFGLSSRLVASMPRMNTTAAKA